MLAVVGVAAMVTAVVTGSVVIGWVIIGLAGLGLFLLATDSRRVRRDTRPAAGVHLQPGEHDRSAADVVAEGEIAPEERVLKPERFEPDVSYEEAIDCVPESDHPAAGGEATTESSLHNKRDG
jgi:hypothetical protein